MDSLLHFELGSSDDVVHLVSDAIDLLLSVKTSSDVFIGFDEAFQFFLQTIVLVVQVRHMLVKSIHLGLQLDLVLVHLLRVLLKATNFISNAVFVLL